MLRLIRIYRYIVPLFFFATVACTSEPKALEREYAAAVDLYRGGDTTRARAEFSRLYATAPDYRQTALIYGRLLYYAGSFGAAADVFEKAPASTGTTPGEIGYWRARSLARLDRKDAAVEILAGVLHENPEHLDALLLKGRLHDESGETDQAIACYRQVLAARLSIISAHQELSRIYARVGLPDQAAAHQRIAGVLFSAP